jgi:S-adenosyl-L-methionine hydrolase (adenosine-forming)
MKRPIVTLTTDFGTSGSYVAEMKAAILAENPDCNVIDVTHQISPQDVVAGSIVLGRIVATFPPRSIHLAVIDPGVGTRRRLLVAKINRQRVICPDNGLITWAWRTHDEAKAYELTWRPEKSAETFHGRDILAPAAAMLSRGRTTKSIASRIDQPMLLEIKPATGKRGVVIHIDRFGNAITNIVGHPGSGSVRAGRKTFGVHRTYSAVPRGKPVAVIGSSGLLEIAIRDGNAAKALGLRVGHEVVVQ